MKISSKHVLLDPKTRVETKTDYSKKSKRDQEKGGQNSFEEFKFDFQAEASSHSSHSGTKHHKDDSESDVHLQRPSLRHVGTSAGKVAKKTLGFTIERLRKLHDNPKTHYTFDFIAIAVLVGVVFAVATHGGLLAAVVLAILPTLCVGVWIAFRVPQKVKVDDLTLTPKSSASLVSVETPTLQANPMLHPLFEFYLQQLDSLNKKHEIGVALSP